MRYVLFLALLSTVVGAGLSDAAWTLHSIDDEGRGADGVRMMDVNGDGLLDIASGWEEQGETRVYLHPGQDKVREEWPKVVVGTPKRPEDAVFCDLDGDGAVDVISSTEGVGPGVAFHWAPQDPGDYMDASAWETRSFPGTDRRGWMFCVPLQLDGRNGPDLVCGGKRNDLVWFEAPENPRVLAAWKKHVISSECDDGWTMGIYAEDMDDDGDPDIVWTTRKGEHGGVRWMENPGPGPRQAAPWTMHTLSPEPADYMFGDVADLDGDGLPDVVVPIRQRDVMFFRMAAPGGQQWEVHRIPYDPAGGLKGAGVGDVNLDGKKDIVLTFEGRGPVRLEYENSPTEGPWREVPLSGHGGKQDLVRLYDVDGDGDLDLFTTIEGNRQVVWYENPTRTPHRHVDWKLAYSDPCTGDWRENWSLDGDSSVVTGSEGMTFYADKGHHDVLWFRPVIEGDIRVEYDYLNFPTRGGTTILFIEASGKDGGQYPEDILQWSEARSSGRYSLYKGEMNYVSVSYSNPQNEVRLRQCPGFQVIARHENANMFQPGQLHHIVAEKVGRQMRFTVTNRHSGVRKSFEATLAEQPAIAPGRIGLRNMNNRKVRYSDFKLYVRKP